MRLFREGLWLKLLFTGIASLSLYLLLPLVAVQQTYAQYGITTIQDGATDPATLKTLQKAASSGLLELDVVAFPLWTTAVESIALGDCRGPVTEAVADALSQARSTVL